MGDEPNRRSILKGIGAGTGVVVTASTPDWGEMTDLGPDDWEPGMPASEQVQAPDTLKYNGREIELVGVVGSCRDLLRATGKESGLGLDISGKSSDGYCVTDGVTPDKDGKKQIKNKGEQAVVDKNFTRFGETDANFEVNVSASDIDISVDSQGVSEASVTSCDATADPQIKMHDWYPPYELTKRCKEAWCQSFETGIKHEIEHAKDYENFAPAFDTWVANNEPNIPLVRGVDDANAETIVEAKLLGILRRTLFGSTAELALTIRFATAFPTFFGDSAGNSDVDVICEHTIPPVYRRATEDV